MCLENISPLAVALVLLFIYTNICNPDDVKEIWPDLHHKCTIDSPYHDDTELIALVQSYALSEHWLIPDLEEPLRRHILNWKFPIETWYSYAVWNTPPFPAHLLNLLSIVFHYAPGNTMLRAELVVESTRFSDFNRWVAYYPSDLRSMTSMQIENCGWCEQVRQILMRHELLAYRVANGFLMQVNSQVWQNWGGHG
jgi:hypothetical protein